MSTKHLLLIFVVKEVAHALANLTNWKAPRFRLKFVPVEVLLRTALGSNEVEGFPALVATVLLVLVLLNSLGTTFWAAYLDARRFVFLPKFSGKGFAIKDYHHFKPS